jgi:protein TonB
MTLRPQLVPVVCAVVAVGLLVLVVRNLLESGSARSAPVQAVTLLEPPPPVAQTPEEAQESIERPEQLEVGEWIAASELAETSPIAADDVLGVDETGVAGSDAFGLAGKPGGRELLLATRTANDSAQRAELWTFAAQLEDELERELARFPELRRRSYTVQVEVWVAATGVIEKVALARTSGDDRLDDRVRDSLLRIAPVVRAPPASMPQPIRLRLTSRVSAHAAELSRN